jgi:hypothetical protein
MFFLHKNRFFTFLPKFFCGVLLLVYSAGAFAQVKREHLYKLRGGNRFEGVKTKEWKPVSGVVELASLVFVDKEWLQEAAQSKNDSVSIFFYSTIAADIDMIRVFNLERQYFMEPRISAKNKFGKGWNAFTWPANILKDIGLPLTGLSGIVKGQKGRIYFPIGFKKPAGVSKTSVLKTLLIPDKNMIVDIALYGSTAGEPLKTWKAQSLKSDAPFALELPGALFPAGQQAFVLKVTEKGGREFSYNIQLFKS